MSSGSSDGGSSAFEERRPLRRSMSEVVEDLKRGNLIRPRPGETAEEAEEGLYDDLEEHDRLNLQLTSEQRVFDPGSSGKFRSWQDIPRSAEMPRRVVFMFMVMDKLKNEDWWRAWFQQADADGHQDDYSIVYHRGAAYGAAKDPVSNDFLAEKGVAVWPPTKTGWARSGLVRATLLLMRYGLEMQSNQWFLLLSDTCMPLYTFHDFYNQVTRQMQSRFNDFGFTLDVTMQRHVWQQGPGACEFSRRSNKADQWAMWLREDAEWFVRENHLVKLKPLAVFVDEPYFINMMDQHERPYQQATTTYTKWYHPSDLPSCCSGEELATLQKMGSSPHTFAQVDMAIVRNARRSGGWFMRKVAAGAKYPRLDELELVSLEGDEGQTVCSSCSIWAS
eukprot:TRINITY_DN47435_c0_g1_i1.p1 TRINITY_DN47435_c0_g1~~TRINITY_DN47435_c0_g1_i1.p1  ORF type:complete len:391 (+),score=97.22 TRINITY_DN47435_c0_g1_i1:30-1202(+)